MLVVPSACLPYRLITKPINIHRARSKCVIYVGGHSATNDSRTNSAHPGISIDRPRIWGLKLSAQSISPPRHQPATLIWRDLIFLDRSSNGGCSSGALSMTPTSFAGVPLEPRSHRFHVGFICSTSGGAPCPLPCRRYAPAAVGHQRAALPLT